MGVPRDGSIVGWTVTLGKPNATQIKFFNTNEGGESEAGIAVLRPQKSPNLTYKLIASGPLVKLKSYFGKTVQFPLETTIKVKKGDEIALTRADLGAGARARLRQRHLLAREPSEEAVHEHEQPDGPERDRLERAVLLPVPDRASDLQRDRDLDALAAVRRRPLPAPA